MDIQNEIWRDVVGYEGYYQVSNFGRVKSLERVDRFGRVVPERILRPHKDKDGYLLISLNKDGKQKKCKAHRLVAQAFIPNPDNLPIVNHKDEVKANNFVFLNEDGSVDFQKSNLEWCDYKYSVDYGTRNEKVSKRVAQYTLDGELVKIWPSLHEVQRQTGWSCGAISQCCNNKQKTAYGSIWRYAD